MPGRPLVRRAAAVSRLTGCVCPSTDVLRRIIPLSQLRGTALMKVPVRLVFVISLSCLAAFAAYDGRSLGQGDSAQDSWLLPAFDSWVDFHRRLSDALDRRHVQSDQRIWAKVEL